MKTLSLILSILLIVSILGNFIQYRDKQQAEIYRLNTELQFQVLLQDKNKRLATPDSLRLTIRAKDSIDIAYYLEVTNRFKMRNSNLTKEIAKLRSEVQPQIDTIPTIKLLIFLACITPTVYELVDDAKGETKADKRLDFWRASALVLLFALLALYFIGMNPLKIILAAFGWRMLVFDYAINVLLSLNEVSLK